MSGLEAMRIVAVIEIQPGKRDLVRDALREISPLTLAEEGCLGYELYESETQPDTLITVEDWRAPADLEFHQQTDYVQRVIEIASPMLAGAPTMHRVALV